MGGSAAGLELWLLLPLFFADLALHKLAPRLDLSPAESGTQQRVLNAGTLTSSWAQEHGELRDTQFSFPFNFQPHSLTLMKSIIIIII